MFKLIKLRFNFLFFNSIPLMETGEIERSLSSSEIYFLILIFFMHFIGLWGMLKFSNNMLSFICFLELTLLACFLLFMLASIWHTSIACQIYGLLLLVLCAVETAIGITLSVSKLQIKK